MGWHTLHACEGGSRSLAVPHGSRHQESRALPQSRPCPQPPPLPGAVPGTVGAPGVGLWIRWGCAPPLPEMHQCPVLPPQRLDVEPVCTHQDVALLEDREPSGLPALPPVQGSASLGRHSTRHGRALGLSQGSSPSPRPKSPSVGHRGGFMPSGAAPTDCHLPPARQPGSRSPSHAQASGPRLQGLVKTTGRMEGLSRAALGLR